VLRVWSMLNVEREYIEFVESLRVLGVECIECV